MGYLLAILFILQSCAKQEAPVATDSPSGEIVIQESGLTKVYGNLTVDGVPTADLSVWILDLTAGKKLSTLTNAEGEWSIPTSKLIAGHVYAFHLFDSDSVRLAIIDFSSTAGLQGAVTYSGGYGMDFGTINLPLDTFGLIDLSALLATPPQVIVAGGFELNKDKTGAIDDMSLPVDVDEGKSGFGHTLICDVPSEILNSFYLSSTHPNNYQLAINKFSGFFIKMVPVTGITFKHIWAALPVNWMMQARRKLSTFSSYFSAIPWEASKRIVLAKSDIIEADFSLPKLPCLGCAMDFYLGRLSSQPDELLTQGISTRIFMIPKITAVRQSGVSFSIDYSDQTLENGLTKPFTLLNSTNSIDLVVSRPLREAMTAALDQRQIMIKFSYSAAGQAASPTSTDYPAPYNVSFKDSQTEWDLETQVLTRYVSDGLSQDNLTIPYELLVGSRTDIDTVTLQIVYESSNSRAGTLISFAR